MDAAPNFMLNDDSNTPSNHQSPSTLNSISRTEDPPPQKLSPSNTDHTTQIPINALNVPSCIGGGTDPSQFSDPSSLARHLNQDTTSFYPTGPGMSFSMPSPSAWDFPNSQANVSSPENVTSGPTDSYAEAQLAQFILDTTWRG